MQRITVANIMAEMAKGIGDDVTAHGSAFDVLYEVFGNDTYIADTFADELGDAFEKAQAALDAAAKMFSTRNR